MNSFEAEVQEKKAENVTGYFPNVKGTIGHVGVKSKFENNDPVSIVIPEGNSRGWRESRR